MDSRIKKSLICIAVALVILVIPPPAGLSATAWQIFAVYVAAILGMILRPFPEPVVLLAAVSALSIALRNPSGFLVGYSTPITWLILSAFMIGTAFAETGLGRRIAFLLIKKFGHTTMRLGYVAAFTDLALSPVTPANTARTGAIIWPIFRSIASTLGSEPGPTARRAGSYFALILYQISLTTGTLFVTATAPNLLMLSFSKKILNVDVSWLEWVQAAIVPGMIILLLIPFVVYKLYPPEMKEIDNIVLADTELAKLGPMTKKEKILAVLFTVAIIGWLTGSITKIDASSIAVGFVACSLITGILSWDHCLNAKGGWSTFMWYGGIIGIADALSKAKFFEWLAQLFMQNLNFQGYNQVLVMAGLVFFSIIIRYLFASQGAFVVTMTPVLLTLASVANVPALPITLLLCYAAAYASMLTHYGGALGPILFGPGYVSQKQWWTIGAVVVALSFIVDFTIGLSYWKLIGLW